MITINIDPVIFHVGHFGLRWYGVILATSIGVGVWLASREARRKGILSTDFDDAVLWVVLAGLVGARLFHVLDHWPHEYASNPLRALYVWEGGLAIWGAVAGGFLAMAVFAWRRGLNLARLADVAVPGLVLAQGLGRVACIITGDAMGKPTDGPLGIAYTNPGAMVPQLGVYYTPLPVYELVMNLAIFLLVWQLRRKPWADGTLFLVYLSLYSVGRFLSAYTSSYQIVAFGLTQSQLVALLGLAITAALGLRLVVRNRHGPAIA